MGVVQGVCMPVYVWCAYTEYQCMHTPGIQCAYTEYQEHTYMFLVFRAIIHCVMKILTTQIFAPGLL